MASGYAFFFESPFWKGLPVNSRRIDGDGFAISSKLLQKLLESSVAISERLMTQNTSRKTSIYHLHQHVRSDINIRR